MEKIKVLNIEGNDLQECVVVREEFTEYWFYCSYSDIETALRVAKSIGNGVVLHKDWIMEEEHVQIPTEKLSPMLRQFIDLKKKHPDALLLFRCGDFYETYMDDAEKASKTLGITLTKSSKQKDTEGKPLAMAGFPYRALDTYLPKLVRAGYRIAICDQIEAPKPTKTLSITEMVKKYVENL